MGKPRGDSEHRVEKATGVTTCQVPRRRRCQHSSRVRNVCITFLDVRIDTPRGCRLPRPCFGITDRVRAVSKVCLPKQSPSSFLILEIPVWIPHTVGPKWTTALPGNRMAGGEPPSGASHSHVVSGTRVICVQSLFRLQRSERQFRREIRRSSRYP